MAPTQQPAPDARLNRILRADAVHAALASVLDFTPSPLSTHKRPGRDENLREWLWQRGATDMPAATAMWVELVVRLGDRIERGGFREGLTAVEPADEAQEWAHCVVERARRIAEAAAVVGEPNNEESARSAAAREDVLGHGWLMETLGAALVACSPERFTARMGALREVVEAALLDEPPAYPIKLVEVGQDSPRLLECAGTSYKPAVEVARISQHPDDAPLRVQVCGPVPQQPRQNHQNEGGPLPPARYSPDFRYVHWFGTDYEFTKSQGAIVEILWGAWVNGTPAVGHETLLRLANLDTKRLVDVFDDHPAWGTMILSGGTKGSARLQSPR